MCHGMQETHCCQCPDGNIKKTTTTTTTTKKKNDTHTRIIHDGNRLTGQAMNEHSVSNINGCMHAKMDLSPLTVLLVSIQTTVVLED